MAKGVGESVDVRRDVASGPGIERCTFDCGVAHETTSAANPSVTGVGVAGEGVSDRVEPGVGGFDRGEHVGQVFSVVALQSGFEESLLRSELGVHALAVDAEFGNQFGRAGVGEALHPEQLDGAVEQLGSVVLLRSTHRHAPQFRIQSGRVSLRVNGHMHHIGLGRTLDGTRVIMLIDGYNTRIIHATTGEILRTLTIPQPPLPRHRTTTRRPQRTPKDQTDHTLNAGPARPRCPATSHGADDGNRTRVLSLGS